MITSTYATAQGRQDGLASGADAYLIEPVPADRLVQIIRRFLEPGQFAVTETEAWIVTDDRGVMLEISGPGHRLLNLSARGALGRSLPAFFAGERHQVFGDIARALDGHVSQREAQLRPRDRRPFSVAYEICREPSSDNAIPRLRWALEPIRTNNTSH
jgi:DNA-binding response OmpR family regulator